MSAKDYQDQVVKPALAEEDGDRDFVKKVVEKKKKVSHLIDKYKNIKLGETEHEIQKRILERLSFLKNGFFWRENSGMVKQTDARGKVRMWRAGIKGIADIVGVYQGRFIAIEVKRKGKKPSLDQKAFLQRIEDCGGIAFVCDDDTNVISQLEEIYEKNTSLEKIV